MKQLPDDLTNLWPTVGTIVRNEEDYYQFIRSEKKDKGYHVFWINLGNAVTTNLLYPFNDQYGTLFDWGDIILAGSFFFDDGKENEII